MPGTRRSLPPPQPTETGGIDTVREVNMDEYWRIQLLGGLCLVRGDQIVRRFRSQKTASLLGYLACHLDRARPRDELVELFWPDEALEAGRHSLRQALTSLR